MAKKPLRSQLNQIRAWVRQGRTDAWIAHQLDLSTSELSEFRRRHELSADDEPLDDGDLRDEIEAEIEAAAREEALAAEEDEEDDGDEDDGEDEEPDEDDDADDESDEREEEPVTTAEGGDGAGRRRRGGRRRGGRRRGSSKRPGAALEATFDHGADEGFGLWLDPAVEDDPIYAQHWKGHRSVEVTVEPERIVIRRS